MIQCTHYTYFFLVKEFSPMVSRFIIIFFYFNSAFPSLLLLLSRFFFFFYYNREKLFSSPLGNEHSKKIYSLQYMWMYSFPGANIPGNLLIPWNRLWRKNNFFLYIKRVLYRYYYICMKLVKSRVRGEKCIIWKYFSFKEVANVDFF